MRKIIFLFAILFAGISNSFALSLLSDTSAACLNKLTKKKIYYINQTRKTNVPEAKRNVYKTKIEELNKEIDAIYVDKRNSAKGSKEQLENLKKDSADRAGDFEIARIFNPELYPVEEGALLVGMQVSFLKPYTYTMPFTVFAEKTVNEKITVGGFFTHFTEMDATSKGFPDKEFKDWSYTAKSKNYTYSNYGFGLKGSYHFFNPASPFLGLSVTKWDFYVTAQLGYSLATKPEPFLIRKSFERTPNKDGLLYGAYFGGRYYYDERLAFHLEAGYGVTGYANIGFSYKFVKSAVVIEKPLKGKGKGKSSSKGKSSGKKKKKK